jgi:hypothetical protein
MQDAPLPNTTTTPTQRTRQADLKWHCHGFGGVLEPRYIVGAGPLDQ